MKAFMVAVVVIFMHDACFSQNCSCISGTTNEQTGTTTSGGTTSSKDHYTLLLQKQTSFRDTTVIPQYFVLLNAASRVMLSDSMVKSQGKLELLLADSTKLTLDSAKCSNIEWPFGLCVGFSVAMTRDQLEIISKSPIVTFSAFGILTTSFDRDKQKDQQTIATCLLNEK